MTSRDFAYWLQGFLEVANPQSGISAEQTETIRKHLSMVFAHEIDPSFPKPQQTLLQNLHDGNSTLFRC